MIAASFLLRFKNAQAYKYKSFDIDMDFPAGNETDKEGRNQKERHKALF